MKHEDEERIRRGDCVACAMLPLGEDICGDGGLAIHTTSSAAALPVRSTVVFQLEADSSVTANDVGSTGGRTPVRIPSVKIHPFLHIF